MEKLYKKYRDDAAFLFVYIQEAHPEDGWQLESNTSDGVVFEEPNSLNDRKSIAKSCTNELSLSMPCVVDTMANTVDDLYAGWPERMFVIDRDGRITYAGKRGPWGFKVNEVKRALKKLLR